MMRKGVKEEGGQHGKNGCFHLILVQNTVLKSLLLNYFSADAMEHERVNGKCKKGHQKCLTEFLA